VKIMNYSKNGFCTAKKHTDCENFRPVHDLEICTHYGWGNTCELTMGTYESDPVDEYIKKLKQEAENARSTWRFFHWWRISDEIRQLKKIQRLCADPVDTIADIQDCR